MLQKSWRRPVARVQCQRVHDTIARDIAANFVTERSVPGRPVVRAAYEQLRAQTDRIFFALTTGGCEYRVVFTRLPHPYGSDVEMLDAVCAGHLLEVSTAAAARDRRHPMLDCSTGGAYDRFRAVHDLLGHVVPRLGFDRDGEYTAWLLQRRLHGGLARWALATELHGENSVLWTTHELCEHKAVLLDPGLLRASREAGALL
jgi:hypothetical protein